MAPPSILPTFRPSTPPTFNSKHSRKSSSCGCLHSGKQPRSSISWTLVPAVIILGSLQAYLNLRSVTNTPFGHPDLRTSLAWALTGHKVEKREPLPTVEQVAEVNSGMNPNEQIAEAPGEGRNIEEVKQRAGEIHNAWAEMFKLNDPAPPRDVPAPKGGDEGVPWAPHLEECVAVQEQREASEKHPEAGGYPEWACAAEGGAICDYPSPPWIRGEDKNNLPMTRRVQRDLWVHQFPSNCSDPSLGFLIVDWGDLESHGMGSQIHIMTASLSLALHFGRILVPSGFQRADHDECEGVGHRNSWTCYFSNITSDACVEEAWRLADEQNLTEPSWDVMSVYNSSRVVWVTHDAAEQAATPFVDRFWGTPWENQSAPFYEELGSVDVNSSFAHLIWWRSQALRFMMRWSSAYLCHLTNKARHRTYGHLVALEIADAEAQQKYIHGDSNPGLVTSEKEALAGAWRKEARPLETNMQWRMRGRDGVYMPRLMMSMHVRQGDKGREMKLFEFQSYMWMANRVRRMYPGIQYIWLSTEMQSVVEATQNYKDWTFFYTEVERQNAMGVEMREYELQQGVQDLAGNSFANLVIASECDAFVGVLGSNWNRMINELRLTNGRMNAGYFTLNNGFWG